MIYRVSSFETNFIALEDGKIYYWPKTEDGVISADQLRQIAEELDRRNNELEKK